MMIMVAKDQVVVRGQGVAKDQVVVRGQGVAKDQGMVKGQALAKARVVQMLPPISSKDHFEDTFPQGKKN